MIKKSFYAVLASLLLISCGGNVMVVTAELAPEKDNPFLYAKAYDEEGNQVDSVGIVDNKFVLTFPTKEYPTYGKISMVKKRGAGNKKVIVTPGKVTFTTDENANTSSGTSNVLRDNGGYNDLIYNNPLNDAEYTEKFGAWNTYQNANRAEYFSSKTPIERKMEIRVEFDKLAKVYRELATQLMTKYLTSEDDYLVAFAIEKTGVNKQNEKYVPAIVEKLGARHKWVADFTAEREKFLVKQARESKIEINEPAIDIKGMSATGKELSLLATAAKNKVTMLVIYGNGSESSEYMPFVNEVYDLYKNDGFEVFGVWGSKPDRYAEYAKKNEIMFNTVTQLDGDIKEITNYYMTNKGFQIIYIDSKGKIIGHISHRYQLKPYTKGYLNK